METYFNIRYEFDKSQVHARIAKRLESTGSAYICVADSNILATVHKDLEYRRIINNSLFTICDSGYVPIYLKWIHGIKRAQYRGADIFRDIISNQIYSMAFIGTNESTLKGLRNTLIQWNPKVNNMLFEELPFKKNVNEFDYERIAALLDKNNVNIIWVALGAPKQEYFMSLLQSRLKGSHILIGVGAVFNFFGNSEVKLPPSWVVRYRIEWIYRVIQEPRKQIHKIKKALKVYPSILWEEYKKHNN